MDSAQALHQFWSSFDWKAYDENTVPSKDRDEVEPEMPRITYNVANAEFEQTISLAASLWDRSFSWTAISQKAEEIYDYIGLGGRLISYDDGRIWIRRGAPFAQRMTDDDDAIRRIYLNLEVEYFTSK